MSKSKFQPVFKFFRGMNQRSSIALMATVVSTCALCVSFYQASLSRRQQLATVWPYLSIGGYGTANGEHQTWGIRAVNNGLGPAIVEEIQVKLSGETFDFQTCMDSLYARHLRLDSLKNLNYSMNEIGKGTVISAGSTVEWISFDLVFSSKIPGEAVSKHFMPKLELLIRYKSLYGERWESCFNCPGDPVQKIR